MPYMPPEVVDLILGELHPSDWDWQGQRDEPLNGKQDIHACSLVSHAWNAVALPFLFRDLNYTFFAEDPPEVPYELRATTRYKTFAMLRHFMDERPHAAKHVRRLRLDQFQTQAQGDPGGMVDAEDFVALLRALPQLRVLLLHDVVLSGSVADEWYRDRPLPLHYLRVSCLAPQINGWRETGLDLENLADILVLFGAIDTLHLYRLDTEQPGDPTHYATDGLWDFGGGYHDVDIPGDATLPEDPEAADLGILLPHLEVRSLILTGIAAYAVQPLYNMLRETKVVQSIRALTLEYRISQTAKLDRWLFRSVSQNLREFTYDMTLGTHTPVLDISGCPNLKKLQIDFHVNGLSHPRHILEAINTVLSKRFTFQLDELVFAIVFENVFSPMEFSWQMMCRTALQGLDSTLLRIANTHGLPGVTFACEPMNGWIHELLREMFPRLHRALKVRFGPFTIDMRTRLCRSQYVAGGRMIRWYGSGHVL